MKQMREYQIEVIKALKSLEQRNKRKSVIVHLATGLGKSFTAVKIVEQVYPPTRYRTLFLAPALTLIEQMYHNFLNDMEESRVNVLQLGVLVPRVGISQGKRKDNNARVVVGSVQTLIDKNEDQIPSLEGVVLHKTPQGGVTSDTTLVSPRVDDLLKHGLFDLIVYDEAHHAVSDKAFILFERVKQLHTMLGVPPPMIVGLTATPMREDKRGLDNVFDEILISRDFRWAQQKGYLVPFATPLQIVLRSFDNLEELTVNQTEYEDYAAAIYEAWQTHARDRKCIGFTNAQLGTMTGVETSRFLTSYFQEKGVRAFHVDGLSCIDLKGKEKPVEYRHKLFDEYRRGNVDVMFSFGVGLEGLDLPNADCLLWMRSTENAVLMTQAVGRILRPALGKKDALIIDFAGRGIRVSPLGSLFGLKVRLPDDEIEEEDTEVLLEEIEGGGSRNLKEQTKSSGAIETRIAKIMISSDTDWYMHPETRQMCLSISDTITLFVEPPDSDVRYGLSLIQEAFDALQREESNPYTEDLNPYLYTIYNKLTQLPESKHHNFGETIQTFMTMFDRYSLYVVDSAQKTAVLHDTYDELEDALYHGIMFSSTIPSVKTFMKRNATWKNKPASDKQHRLLRILKLDDEVLSAREASHRIAYGLSQKQVRQAREELQRKSQLFVQKWGVPL